MKKQILYVDMDNVLVDFNSGIESLSQEDKIKYKSRYDECPDIFSLMVPLNGAVEAYEQLSKNMTHISFPLLRGIILLLVRINYCG